MAQKIITDLQLIAAAVDGLSLPTDDGLQTYRVTTNQLKAYVLANGNITLPMLDTDIFHGLSAVTVADDDYIPVVDTSDSNLTKKVLANSFRNAVYRAVTTTDSVGASDETMKLSGASFTSTLPTAVGVAGKRYKYIHAGTSLSQVYTIATTSGQTVGGIASGSYSLYTNGEVLEIESDGANWIIVGRHANTAWTDYSPTFVGFGTVTLTRTQWRRLQTDLLLSAKVTIGTRTGTEARMPFPAGPTALASIATVEQAGTVVTGASTSVYYTTIREPSTSYICFGWNTGTSGLTKQNGNAIFGDAAVLSIEARIPITGWQP